MACNKPNSKEQEIIDDHIFIVSDYLTKSLKISPDVAMATAKNTIEIRNQNYPLTKNPDGSISMLYNQYKESGYNYEETILHLASLRSDKSVQQYGDWFTDYTSEPVVDIQQQYTSRVGRVYNSSELYDEVVKLPENKDKLVTISESNVDRSNISNESNIVLYGEYRAGVDLVKSIILKYVDKVMAAEDFSEEKDIFTVNIKQIVLDELDGADGIFQYYRSVKSPKALFINTLIEDIINNVENDAIYSVARNEIEKEISFDINDISGKEDAVINEAILEEEDSKDTDSNGADGRFLKLLFDKHDHKTSTRDSIHATVKRLIYRVPSKVFDVNGKLVTQYNPYTGVAETFGYFEMLNLIREKLSNIVDTQSISQHDNGKMLTFVTNEQLLETLKRMAITIPSVQFLYDELHNSYENGTELINAFNFSMGNLKSFGVTTIITNETNDTINSETRLIYIPNRHEVANKFGEKLRARLGNLYYSKEMIEEMRSDLVKATGPNTYIHLVKVLDKLGVSFKAYQLEIIADNSLMSYIDIKAITSRLLDQVSLYATEVTTKFKGIEESEDLELSVDESKDILNVLDRNSKRTIVGSLAKLAEVYSEFVVSGYEATYMNAASETEYSIIDNNYINTWISEIGDTTISYKQKDGSTIIGDRHKSIIDKLLRDRRFEHAYWTPSINIIKHRLNKKGKSLFNEDGTIIEGVLNNKDYYAILTDLRKITNDSYGGTKNNASGIKGKNQDINKEEWVVSIINTYVQNVVALSETNDTVRTTSIILSDSSQLNFFKQDRITPFSVTNNTNDIILNKLVNKANTMFRDKDKSYISFNNKHGNKTRRILRNSLVLEEIRRMVQDTKSLFDFNESTGSYTLKEVYVKNPELLVANEHTIRGEVYDKAGIKVIGNSFKFNTIPAINDIFTKYGLFNTETGLLLKSVDGLIDALDSDIVNPIYDGEINNIIADIDNALLDYVSDEVDDLHKTYGKYESKINHIIKSNKFFSKKITDVNKDKSYNVSNTTHKYKSLLIDMAINTMVSNQEQMLLFQGTTSAHKDNIDVNKRAKKLVSPGRTGGLSGFKNNDLRVAIIKDVVLKSQYIERVGKVLNDESKSEILKEQYKKLEIADGQGYLTADGYAKMLISWGMFTPVKQHFIETDGVYTLKEDIADRDLLTLLKPIKPYYANSIFLDNFNKHTSIQVKDSLVLLVPKFIKGTDLEKLHDSMYANNIEQALMVTAIKNGIHNVNNISNSDGIINDNAISKLVPVVLERDKFRNQVDTVNHHMDTHIKAGIQIFKLILSDINDTHTFKYNGSKISGLELKQKYHGLINSILNINSKSVVDRMRKAYAESGEVADTQLRDILLDIGGKLMSDADKSLLDVDDNGKFIIPLDLLNKGSFEQLLNSVYTKNITNLSVPGLHNVYASNAFMNVSAVSDIAFNDVHNLAKDKRKNKAGKIDGNLQSYFDEDLQKWVMEAYISPWSKDFYNEDGTLKDINDLSIDLRTMLGYRIPTSARHSAITIKVVGFTPNIMGSVVLLPHDVIARTGADFDIDTFYINRKPHEFNKDSSKFTAIKYNNLTKEDYDYNDVYDLTADRTLSYKDYILRNYLKKTDYNDRRIQLKTEREERIDNVFEQAGVTPAQLTEINDAIYLNKVEISRQFKDKQDLLQPLIIKLEEEKANMSEIDLELIKEEKALNKEFEAARTNNERYKVIVGQQVNKANRINNNKNLYTLKDNIKVIQAEIKKNVSDMKSLTVQGKPVAEVYAELNKIKEFHISAKKELFNEYVDMFLKQGKEKYHSTDVMAGEILEIMNTIMSDKALLYENTLTASFEKSREEAEMVEKTVETFDDNPIKLSTQIALRERGRLGKEVLSIFANVNTGFTIFQDIQAKVVVSKDNINIAIPYSISSALSRYNKYNNTKLTKKQFVDQTKAKYKEDYIPLSSNSFKIIYKNIAHNNDGSYTNIFNQPILAEFGQLVDHAPDNVKEPLIRNTHPFTTSALVGYSIGGDVTYGLRVIAQKGISTILDSYNNNTSISSVRYNAQLHYYNKIIDLIQVSKAIEKGETVTKTTDRLFKQLVNVLGTNDISAIRKFVELVKAKPLSQDYIKKYNKKYNKNIDNRIVKRSDINKVNRDNNGEYTTELKTYDELEDLLKQEGKYNDVSLDIDEVLDYFENQIDIIDRFVDVHKVGKDINSTINMLNADKKGTGKNITENLEYIKDIIKFDVENSVVTSKNGETESAIHAIYTTLTDSKYDSLYESLNSYSINSNVAALKYSQGTFKLHTGEPVYNAIYKSVLNILGSNTDKDKLSVQAMLNKIISYNAVINNLPAFKNIPFYNEPNYIFGENNDIDIVNDVSILDDKDNIDQFKQLSLANKIQLIIDKYGITNDMQQEVNVRFAALAYLTPELSYYNIAKNNFHNIGVDKMTREPKLKAMAQQSFIDMFNSTDEFLSSTAEQMIHYSVYKNGLQGGNNSMSHIISPKVFKLDDYKVSGIYDNVFDGLNTSEIIDATVFNLVGYKPAYVVRDIVIEEGSDMRNYDMELWNMSNSSPKVYTNQDFYSSNFPKSLFEDTVKVLHNSETNESKVYSFETEIVKEGTKTVVNYIVTSLGINAKSNNLSSDSFINNSEETPMINTLPTNENIKQNMNITAESIKKYNQAIDSISNKYC